MFCGKHMKAPPGQRGGWLSAFRRQEARAVDASCITPGAGGRSSGPRRSLWVGAMPPTNHPLPDFDAIVLLTEEQPDLAFRGQVVRMPIRPDALANDDMQRAVMASRFVADALVRRQRVLISCARGVQRAPLVACIALALVTRLSCDQLIAVMRRRRHPDALNNQQFRSVLRTFVGR